MIHSPIARQHRSMAFKCVLFALVVAIPRPASGGDQPEIKLYEFVTVEQLAFGDNRPEDRIGRYEAVLAEIASATDPDEKPRRRHSLPTFPEIVTDFSTLSDPKDAFAAAHYLTETVGSRKLYEQVGVSLLRAARLARFAREKDRALHHLRAARHAFVLADREKHAEGTAAGEKDFIYRAMVRLEEILVTDSEKPWTEAAEMLARQLEVTPTGAIADWARRISNDPDTYIGEPRPVPDTALQFVGGDVLPPVKIFAPPLRYSEFSRRACSRGVVIIQAIIDRHGSVAAVRLLKDLPMGLPEEAMRTLATWLFEPATLYGQPITVYYSLALNFGLTLGVGSLQPSHPERVIYHRIGSA